MRRRLAGGLAALLASAPPLLAHDLWIEPSSWHPRVGSTIAVRLFVGSSFQGEPFPRLPQLVSRFVLVSDSGETPIPGQSGEDPAGAIRIEQAGLLIVGYRSHNYPMRLDAAKFETYLKEEGLESILERRARRGESEKPVAEVFSRCAKALLSAGDGGSAGYDRALQLTLELIPEKNPYAMKPGDSLPVRLLYEGKPLVGALVQALAHRVPSAAVSARTDRNGRARLRLARGGVWLVKAVQMTEAPKEAGGADWQSLWASLTFELPGEAAVGKTSR